MRSHRVLGRLALAGVIAGTMFAGVVSPVAAAPRGAPTGKKVTVIATKLNNPRGIALGPGGVLFVAEAGKGGSGPCVPSPEGEGEVCLGATGAVSVVSPLGRSAGTESGPAWKSWRLVSGLPSVAGPDGGSAIGLHDLVFGPGGKLFGTLGLGGSPSTRSALGPRARLLGHVVALRPGAGATAYADLAAFEARRNPDSADPDSSVDSNPYGLLSTHDGLVATDAGGNDVLRIGKPGHISTLAVLHARMVEAPPFLGLPPGTKMPMQAVPTTVVRGPDGAFYVGQLTGFPFPPGGANVWRVVPGKAPTVYASAFTNIIDIAFDHKGRLLVLQISKSGLLTAEEAPAGALFRVEKNGKRTEIAPGALTLPGGLAVGFDSTLYVTNKSIVAGGGEVLRIRP
jgi:hypothetical protein